MSRPTTARTRSGSNRAKSRRPRGPATGRRPKRCGRSPSPRAGRPWAGSWCALLLGAGLQRGLQRRRQGRCLGGWSIGPRHPASRKDFSPKPGSFERGAGSAWGVRNGLVVRPGERGRDQFAQNDPVPGPFSPCSDLPVPGSVRLASIEPAQVRLRACPLQDTHAGVGRRVEIGYSKPLTGRGWGPIRPPKEIPQ